MTLENLLSQMGTGSKQLTDRYSDYAGPVHDHEHVYYAYEPSAPPHAPIASSKHHYGGGHKSGASMSALTLLAFLFFLHILQQCIKDHMMEMSTAQPVMVMTAGREGDDTISKSVSNKIDKTGITQIDEKTNTDKDEINSNNQHKLSEMQNYVTDEQEKGSQLLKVHTSSHIAKTEDQKHKYVIKNNSNRHSYFPGFVSAMDDK